MIETGRLIIIPFNYEELGLYLQSKGKLEKKLQLTDTGRTVVPEIRDRVQNLILPKMKGIKTDHYLFYTFWIVVEKFAKIIVAELGFKGEPDTKAEIEIGYGTLSNHRGKGYMTEALGGMISWANNRHEIQGILAETEETNMASIRVLQKNNFLLLEKKKNMLWWRKEVKLF